MINAGVKIFCRSCEKIIATCTKDIDHNMRVTLDKFEFKNPLQKDKKEMRCIECGFPFALHSKLSVLSTEDGWLAAGYWPDGGKFIIREEIKHD